MQYKLNESLRTQNDQTFLKVVIFARKYEYHKRTLVPKEKW